MFKDKATLTNFDMLDIQGQNAIFAHNHPVVKLESLLNFEAVEESIKELLPKYGWIYKIEEFK